MEDKSPLHPQPQHPHPTPRGSSEHLKSQEEGGSGEARVGRQPLCPIPTRGSHHEESREGKDEKEQET